MLMEINFNFQILTLVDGVHGVIGHHVQLLAQVALEIDIASVIHHHPDMEPNFVRYDCIFFFFNF